MIEINNYHDMQIFNLVNNDVFSQTFFFVNKLKCRKRQGNLLLVLVLYTFRRYYYVNYDILNLESMRIYCS